ncbi:hypothetical protein H5410_015206 [Solanum commersonii]|uniref:Uncharacterized protein n=1 Tax=Solanum commersonii TaxID=4109 RepID=A0A9J5ZT23_SOLCO|nr:hypothetical protein H5410_015206 [Solanum commersonii]
MPTMESALPEVGSNGWRSTTHHVVSGALPATLENLEDRMMSTLGRTHNLIRSPSGLIRCAAWAFDGMHGLCVLRRWAPTKTRRRHLWGDPMTLRAFKSIGLYSFGVETAVISDEWRVLELLLWLTLGAARMGHIRPYTTRHYQ